MCAGLIEHVLPLSGCVFSSLAVMKRRGDSIYFEVCLLCSTVERDRMDERPSGGVKERERERDLCCLTAK